MGPAPRLLPLLALLATASAHFHHRCPRGEVTRNCVEEVVCGDVGPTVHPSSDDEIIEPEPSHRHKRSSDSSSSDDSSSDSSGERKRGRRHRKHHSRHRGSDESGWSGERGGDCHGCQRSRDRHYHRRPNDSGESSDDSGNNERRSHSHHHHHRFHHSPPWLSHHHPHSRPHHRNPGHPTTTTTTKSTITCSSLKNADFHPRPPRSEVKRTLVISGAPIASLSVPGRIWETDFVSAVFNGLEVEELDASSFARQNGILKEVRLEDNRLEQFPFGLLTALPGLKVLGLKGNMIEGLGGWNVTEEEDEEDYVFELEALDLSHNRIESLRGTLQHLRTLKVLDLSHNRLRALTTIALPSLQRLDLSHNSLRRVESDSLNTSSLRILDVSHNEVSSLGSYCFSSFDSPVVIDLSHNRLTTFSSEGFEGQDRLQYLNVSSNRIGEVSRVELAPAGARKAALKGLDIRRNRLDAAKLEPLKLLTSAYGVKLLSDY